MVLLKVYKCLRILNKHSYSKCRYLSCTAFRSCKNEILVEHQGQITTIGINKQEKRNCLTSHNLRQLRQALREFDNDDNARVAILHGEGGNFCSGFDIDEILEHGYEGLLEAIKEWQDVPLTRKPLIGALSGYAVAEGFELALACDLRVIEDTALLGALGRRYGAPMLLGGGQRLADLVGTSRALDLVITGRMLLPKELETFGLGARHVSTGTALGQSVNLAMSIQKFPEKGVMFDKLNILRSRWDEDERRSSQFRGEYIEKLKKEAIEQTTKNALKFKEGIGKHGKSHCLTAKEVESWEREDDIEREKYFKKQKYFKKSQTSS